MPAMFSVKTLKIVTITLVVISSVVAVSHKKILKFFKKVEHPVRIETVICSGEWDEYFREIGNVVFNNGKYFFYYTGHKGKNYRGKNDIYVGVATSDDGKNWHKNGKVMENPAEDPHVVVKDGIFYMYFEDKREVPDVRTSLATSVDGVNFSIVKTGILEPKSGVQSISASSPAAIVVDDDIKILYEMYGIFPDGRLNQGQIGLYEFGVQPEAPVFIGSNDPSQYDEFVASDDIVKHGDTYYMSYHTLQSGVKWTAAIATSTDLRHWTRPRKAHFDYGYNDMTVMFFLRGSCYDFIMTDSDKKSIGIYRNLAVKETGLPVCAQ